jgi:hypothetical protein
MIIAAGFVSLVALSSPSLHSTALQVNSESSEVIRRCVERLTADDPEVRGRASKDLVQLGAIALGELEPYLKSDNLELRNQVRGTIERIYETDLLFLARRPTRRVSVELKGAPLATAVDSLFRPFNVCPEFDRFMLKPELEDSKAVTVNLHEASFWEGCRALAQSTGAELAFGFLGDLEFRRRSKVEKPALFTRDFTLLIAKAIRTRDNVRLGIEGHLEPGWLVPSARIVIEQISGNDGKSYLSVFGPSEKPLPAEGRRPDWASFTPEHRIAPKDDVPLGITFSVKGTLILELPTQVEGIQCRPKDLTLPVSYTISGCTLTLTKVRVDEKGYAWALHTKGPKDWKAPQGKSFLEGFEIVLANDRGPLSNPGGCNYAGEGSGGVQSGWAAPREFWSPPNRFCLVRILAVEQVKIPFEIREIEVTDPEDR